MISIYESTTKEFNNNGIKILKPFTCNLRKEDNGEYYIDIQDSIDLIDYYQNGNIIRVSTPWDYQCFRINNIDIENRKINCRANHLYFDIKNYLIKDSFVVDKNCNDAIDHLKNGCDIEPPFNMISDVQSIKSYRCVRKTLEEALNEVINRWGGHLVRNNYNIEIRASIGQNKGVVLSYGKNISSISSKENWDNVITKILPVGKDGILLPETYISLSQELYEIPFTKTISFTQDYNEEDFDSEESYKSFLINDLRQQAIKYLENNKLPEVSYSVSAEIKNVSDVGDLIRVKHPKIKIDLETNVIAIEYDCILKKYTKIEFGNFKNKLGELIKNVSEKITDEVKRETNEKIDFMTKELRQATNEINSSMGNSYVIYENRSEILVVDELPKENAKNVIKINKNGIGFSRNGINGVFNSAWLIDGTLNMQNINVINLIADMIKGGTLKLGSNLNQSGILELYDETNKLISKLDKNGLEVYCSNGDTIKINPVVGFAGFNNQGVKVYWADGEEFHMKKSFVEEEITLAYKIRFIPITTAQNNGVAIVALTGGGN